jgi:hypothetical protein
LKPIRFKEATGAYAENQDQYLTLPVYVDKKGGIVISCWKLSWWEQLVILFTGRLYISILTFRGQLQPQLPGVSFKALKPKDVGEG